VAGPQRGSVIIAVGDEILGGFTLDTNSHWLAGRLHEAGWPVIRIEVVADTSDDIVEAVHRASADPRAARVLVCGGLGPTPDDRTLEAVARALDRPLETHPEALAHVRGILARMHEAGFVASPEIGEGNRKMTLAPRGAAALFNRRGMAPGLAFPLPTAGDDADRWLIVLPGVPRELQTLVLDEVVPRFLGGGTAQHVAELHYRFAIEAEFYEPMQILEREFPGVAVGSYPQTETRELVIRIHSDSAATTAAAVARMSRLRPGAVGAEAAG
jgi:molybdenum cofactor synthesis domain-containing protein